MTTTLTAPTTNGEVDTLGWDTAYIASYRVVNQAITAQKSHPTAFDHTDTAGIRVQGQWKTWQLAPASGAGGGSVHMACTATSGSITLGQETGDLTDAVIMIEVTLADIVSHTSAGDPTAKPGSGKPRKLVVNTNATGNGTAVTVLTSSTYPKLTSPLLLDLILGAMSNYFNAHIGDFTHTFAIMDINEAADTEGFQWLKPTAYSYAVAEPARGGTLDNCAFGLTAMVDGNPIDPHQEQGIDTRALSGLPDGANSAFVISEQMVAKHMLLNGAISCLQGTTAADFTFSSDGKSVVNNKSVLWGHFKTDNGTISPRIDTGNFVLRADDTYVYVEISEATYSPSAGITVQMNLTQKFTFKLVQRTDNKYVFIPDITGLGSPDVKVNVSLSKELQITQLITGIVAAVAGVLVAVSGIGALLAAEADVAVDAGANAADIAVDGAAADAVAEANPVELNAANGAGAADADAGVAAGADQVQQGGVFTSLRFRVAVGTIGALAGLTTGGIAIAKYVVSGDYTNIPAFDDFAANCLGASKWPNTATYELKGAAFRQSLVLATHLQTT